VGRYVKLRALAEGITTNNSAARLQEECQPRDNASYDEDWYVPSCLISLFPVLTFPGHVEKTNDRDYEVEERYEQLLRGLGKCLTEP
jgi:hypothetical protein